MMTRRLSLALTLSVLMASTVWAQDAASPSLSPAPGAAPSAEGAVVGPIAADAGPPQVMPPAASPQSQTGEVTSMTDPGRTQAAPTDAQEAELDEKIGQFMRLRTPSFNPDRMMSLFFTDVERNLMLESRRLSLVRPAETVDETVQGETGELGPDGAPIPESPREVVLDGILYESGKQWTIWLNSTRITPTAIPHEVVYLKVYKDYIELEWLDATTNQIFPIRLRPHQRFNLDARLFLPK